MNIQAIIFDFDGTILDTEVPFFQVWQETFRQHGYELPLAEWAVSLGTSVDAFDPAGLLEQKTGKKINRKEVGETNHQKSLQIILQQPPLPGAEQYIADGVNLGLKLAVASSSDRRWVHDHLKRLGLFTHFDCTCTEEDVDCVKPDPALFNCAINKLGIDPSEAIIFEDSPHGITAAKAAGIYCVAVPNGLTRHLDIHHADMVLDSLDSLPLDELLKQIQGE